MTDNHLVIPIVNTVLSAKISLFPHQMNNDIYYNLKYNTEKKVKGKCNEFGYVIKVINIEDYNEGIVVGENFTGSAVYNIDYLASLCVPTEKTRIIAKIENINNAIILASHGPISTVITPEKINTLIFTNDIGRYYYKANEDGKMVRKELKKGELIKLTILSKKLYKNDIMISLGFLDDIATDAEKENFYKPELFNVDLVNEETNELVEFHEDDEQNKEPTKEEKNIVESNEFNI